MHIKWVVGKKTLLFMAGLWTFLAIVRIIKGDFFIAGLEIIIALHSLKDARNGEEFTAFELEFRKGAK